MQDRRQFEIMQVNAGQKPKASVKEQEINAAKKPCEKTVEITQVHRRVKEQVNRTTQEINAAKNNAGQCATKPATQSTSSSMQDWPVLQNIHMSKLCVDLTTWL